MFKRDVKTRSFNHFNSEQPKPGQEGEAGRRVVPPVGHRFLLFIWVWRLPPSVFISRRAMPARGLRVGALQVVLLLSTELTGVPEGEWCAVEHCRFDLLCRVDAVRRCLFSPKKWVATGPCHRSPLTPSARQQRRHAHACRPPVAAPRRQLQLAAATHPAQQARGRHPRVQAACKGARKKFCRSR